MDRVLYTGGTFDLFHFGHINFLKQCSRICENVVVSLNTDEFVSEYKEAPIMNYSERERSLLCCNYVKRVVPNIFGADSKPTIISVKPNIIAVGDDWAHKNYYEQMQFTPEWLEEQNITLTYIPYCKDISTTEIKDKIKNT